MWKVALVVFFSCNSFAFANQTYTCPGSGLVVPNIGWDGGNAATWVLDQSCIRKAEEKVNVDIAIADWENLIARCKSASKSKQDVLVCDGQAAMEVMVAATARQGLFEYSWETNQTKNNLLKKSNMQKIMGVFTEKSPSGFPVQSLLGFQAMGCMSTGKNISCAFGPQDFVEKRLK